MSKGFAVADIPSRLVANKDITGFYRMLLTLSLLCFVCSAVGQLVNGCFLHCNVYNTLMNIHDLQLDSHVYVPLREKA